VSEVLQGQRLVRDAARAGNRMIAGSRVLVCLDSEGDTRAVEIANTVVKTCARLGARVTRAVCSSEQGTGTGPVVDTSVSAESQAVYDFLFDLRALPLSVAEIWAPAAVLPPLVVTQTRETAGALVHQLNRDPHVCEVASQRAGVAEFADETGRRVTVLTEPGKSTVDISAIARMEWALRGMPVLRKIIDEHAQELRGLRLTVSLLLEPKTAALALALAQAGAQVTVFSPDNETDRTIAAELAERSVRVCAPTAEREVCDSARDREHARLALRDAEYLIDDGAHLTRLAHTDCRDALNTLRGATEETTSGVRPLHEMEDEGALMLPVIAVNHARTKTLFDNRVGTGESCVLAIADALDESLVGSNWVVFGYGPVGYGCARAAQAFGAEVVIVEQDPIRALSALVDGFSVSDGPEAVQNADVVVSATGVWHTVTCEHLSIAGSGTVFAVAGGIDDEIALDDAELAGWTKSAPSNLNPNVDVWQSPANSERAHDTAAKTAADHIRVLADGLGVNYTAGEGNSIEVMDLSFATQVAALAELIGRVGSGATPGVYRVQEDTEREIAFAALSVRGNAAPRESTASRRVGGAAQHWRVHRFKEDPEKQGL
jgi:adenosylhomocysteinase